MATAGRVRHCFCAGGRNLVTVSVDNRIRLWDVDTAKLRQQYEQKNHLSINYTSVSWAHNAASVCWLVVGHGPPCTRTNPHAVSCRRLAQASAAANLPVTSASWRSGHSRDTS